MARARRKDPVINRLFRFTLGASVTAMSLACLAAVPQPPATASAQSKPAEQAPQQRTADARVLFEFQKRVKEYVDLHRRLEDQLPKLPDQASAAEVRTHQRALAAKIRSARSRAEAGDLFTPEVRRALRRAIARTLGPAERRDITDPESNPAGFKPKVNTEYPASLPVATMPPSVLQSLPSIDEEVEYRFVGKFLILRDTHADLIIDFMTDAIP